MATCFVDFFEKDPNDDFYTVYLDGMDCEIGDSIDDYAPTPYMPPGYSFAGWFKLDDYFQITDEQITTIPEEEYIKVGAKLQSGIAYTLTINYKDTDGNTIATTYQQQYGYGDSYSVNSPSVNLYSLVDDTQAVISGTMPAEDVTVDVIYLRDTVKVIITCKENRPPYIILDTLTVDVPTYTHYSIPLPQIEGYPLYSPSSPVSGDVQDEDVNITAFYSIHKNLITAHHIYGETGEQAHTDTYIFNAEYGHTYTMLPESITDYAPDKSSYVIIMPDDSVEVTFYYYPSTYEHAITALTRQENIYGTISFLDGSVEDLTTSNIQQGSVSITRQCVDSEELMFGGVILGELDMGIWSTRSRYDFYGAEIELTYKIYLYTQDDIEHWEDVPLGRFTVNEADRTNQFISITAYDNLQKLDKEIGTTTITGAPYYLLSRICELCEMQLATSPGTIQSLPNGTEMLSITQDTGKTWRDGVKAICQMLGCFAIADRQGRLILKQFNNTSTRSYTASNRTAVTIADYKCSYNKLVITSLQNEFVSIRIDIDNPLVMYMSAPAWDYGLTPELQERADVLLNYLVDIEYTPCELTIWGDPKLECGDRITNIVGEDGVESLITSYTWNFRGMMDISSVGKNPFFIEKEKDSGGRSASSSVAQSKLIIYEVTNRERVIIPEDNPTLIAETTYYAVKDTFAIYQGNLQINVGAIENLFTDITVLYVLNDDTAHPVNTTVSHFPSGKNIIPLYYLIAGISASVAQKLSLYVYCNDTEITVEKFDLKSTISGQNLVDRDTAWDGRITTTDYVPELNIENHFPGIVIESDPEVDFQEVRSATEVEPDTVPIYKLFPNNRVPVVFEIPEDSTGTYTFAPFFGEDGADNRLTTNCIVSDDHRSWIGAGTIGTDANEITTEAIYGITKLAIFYTGSPQAKLSNDGGTTWLGYNEGTHEWLDTNYMDMSEVNALSSSVLADFEGSNGIMIKIYVAEGTLIHSINAEGGILNA